MARDLVVRLISDAKNFSKGMGQADVELGKFDRRTKTVSRSTSRFAGQVDALNQKFGQLAKLAAGAALAKFGVDSIKAASALDESLNAVNKTFGDSAEQVQAFGRIAAQVVGLSNREFNELATNTGALLTNMGFSFQEAGEEAIKLTRRASDLASVFNTDVGEALNAINAGLRGETEPLRRFGVTLSDAEVRSRAVAMGLAETTAEVDKNGKAVAALALIYEQSNKVAGDFLQTADGLANAQRRASAALEDAQALFGSAATPLAASGISGAAKVILSFRLLLSPLTGDLDRAALAQLRFAEATEYLVDQVSGGRPPMDALADAALFLADAGVLTREEFAALASVVGLTEESFDDFGRELIRRLTDMGAAPEVINALSLALLDVQGPFLDAGNAAGTGADGVGEFAEEIAKVRENVEAVVAAREDFAAFLGLFGSTKASRDAAIIGLANPDLAGQGVDDILRGKSIAEGLFGEAPGVNFEDTEAGQALGDDLVDGFELLFDQASRAGFERLNSFDDFRVYDTFVRYGITARRAFEFGFSPTLFPGGFEPTIRPPGGTGSPTATPTSQTVININGDPGPNTRGLVRELERREREVVAN